MHTRVPLPCTMCVCCMDSSGKYQRFSPSTLSHIQPLSISAILHNVQPGLFALFCVFHFVVLLWLYYGPLVLHKHCRNAWSGFRMWSALCSPPTRAAAAIRRCDIATFATLYSPVYVTDRQWYEHTVCTLLLLLLLLRVYVSMWHTVGYVRTNMFTISHSTMKLNDVSSLFTVMCHTSSLVSCHITKGVQCAFDCMRTRTKKKQKKTRALLQSRRQPTKQKRACIAFTHRLHTEYWIMIHGIDFWEWPRSCFLGMSYDLLLAMNLEPISAYFGVYLTGGKKRTNNEEKYNRNWESHLTFLLEFMGAIDYARPAKKKGEQC